MAALIHNNKHKNEISQMPILIISIETGVCDRYFEFDLRPKMRNNTHFT